MYMLVSLFNDVSISSELKNNCNFDFSLREFKLIHFQVYMNLIKINLI